MTDLEQRLVQFAQRTLAIMEDDPEWSSDTISSIDEAAASNGLTVGAMFKVKPEVFDI